MPVPKSFLEQLNVRTDIVALIGEHLQLRKVGANFVACCPFHNEKTPSFSVNAKLQRYHCFGCNANGDAIQFLRQFKHIDFSQAVELLAHRIGLQVPEEGHSVSKYDKYRRLYDAHELACTFYQRTLNSEDGVHAQTYLRERGLNHEVIEAFRVGYAGGKWDAFFLHAQREGFQPDDLVASGLVLINKNGGYMDRFRNRIMFPIRDLKGRVYAFGGRVLDDSMPKYLNSPQTALFQKGHVVYGLFEGLMQQKEVKELLIVEGYMDVIALAQAGIHYVVACLGTALTTQHIQMLIRYTARFVFCFDGDRAGRRAAWKALSTVLQFLNEQKSAAFLFLPEADDPDSLIRKEGYDQFVQRLAQAQSAMQFLLHTLKAHYNLQTEEGRARFIQHTLFMANKIPSTIMRHFFYEQIAVTARIDMQLLENYSSKKHTAPLQRDTKLQKPCASVRVALALLCRYPDFLVDIPEVDQLRAIQLPDLYILLDAIDVLSSNTDMNTDDISAIVRERHNFDIGQEERMYPSEWPKDKLRDEFVAAIQSIMQQNTQEKINFYMQKLSGEGLSHEEKQILQELLSLKQ